MAQKATRYYRILYYPNSRLIVSSVGKNGSGKVECTTLPDTLQEILDEISTWKIDPDAKFARGRGDKYIRDNPCDIEYYRKGVKGPNPPLRVFKKR